VERRRELEARLFEGKREGRLRIYMNEPA
jgi:hypothetical protein